ncbi:amidohydrolase family protein [Trinickia sp.]|uniref:amidohydrolase family protein n=1 Tax=Trinickia sp. TaxID=2571163 RepID=UPI003F7E1EF3
MRIAGQHCPRWVIAGAIYFNHEAHRFIAADIEIEGDRIAAIKAAGSSRVARTMDARGCVCTPGLIRAGTGQPAPRRLDDHLLRAGITTLGYVCATARECIRAAHATRGRIVAGLTLNAFSSERNAQRHADARESVHELRIFERIAAHVASAGAHLTPAVRCAAIRSAHELVYAHRFAAALGRKLAIALSDSPSAAQAFRERFFCSEMELLAYLHLLGPEVTVWGLSQLTRRDVDILRASGAAAFGAGGQLPSTRRQRAPGASEPHATRLCAFGSGLAVIGGSNCAGGFGPSPGLSAPRGAERVSAADARVDALTVCAAAALGDPTCGRIAPGMRADLCLFSGAATAVRSLGSEAFLRLFARGEPEAVVVGGVLVAGAARASVDETAVSPRRSDSRALRRVAHTPASS